VKKNSFSKALKHLKSTELDEKIQRLNETPTNNMSGVYALNDPGFRVGIPDPAKVYYPDIDGNWPDGIPGEEGALTYTRPAGYWSGGSDWDSQIATDFSQNYLLDDPTGKSTAGLIAEDGTVLAQLPPDSASFILGPIVDGFVLNHTSDAYTNIGYIQKDTRQFVLLGRISGQWKSGLYSSASTPVWDGTSTGFTSYNENFTLAMAQWVRDEILADRYTTNVPYFYSGGVPQVPQSSANCPNCPSGMYGGSGVGGTPFGQGGNPTIGDKQGDPQAGGPEDAGWPWGLLDNLMDLGQDLLDGITDAIDNAIDTFDDIFNLTDDKDIATDEADYALGEGLSDKPELTNDQLQNILDNTQPYYGPAGGPEGQNMDPAGYGPNVAPGNEKPGYQGPPLPGTQTAPPAKPEKKPFNLGTNFAGGPIPKPNVDSPSTTGIPALDYSTDIARSILGNKPLNIPQSQIPKNDIKKLVNGIDPKSIGNQIPVTNKPIPYSDDNFYEDENGKVHPHTPETLKKYPNNTGIVGNPTGFAALDNPLASAGQAQAQIVVPDDGSEPYLLYTDHAYHNLKSTDPGEVPDPIKTALSAIIHGASGKNDPNAPNTGAMSGYPPNIKGDVRKQIKVPLKDLTPEQQSQIDFELNYQNLTRKGKIKVETYNHKIKTVKLFIREQEEVQSSDPVVPPIDTKTPEYKQPGMTTGEKPTDYSSQRLSYFQSSKSDGFVAGYVMGTIEREGMEGLEKMFKGTTISSQTVSYLNADITRYDNLRSEYSEKASQVWEEVHPKIIVLLNRLTEILSWDWSGNVYRYAALCDEAFIELDSLYDRYDQWFEASHKAAEAHWTAMKRMGSYIRNGKLMPMDPFYINDPTVAAELKRRERDKEIERQIKELEAENEVLKTQQQWTSVKMMVMIGFDIATAISLVNVLSGPVDEVAVLGAKTAVQQALDDIAMSAVKKQGGRAYQKQWYGKIQQVADDGLDDLINKMPISKNPLTPDQALRQQGFLTKSGVAHDDFIRQVTSPKTLTRASSAIKQSGTNATIPIKVQGKTIQVKASDILKNKGFKVEFHKPEGKVLTESHKRILREVKKPYKLPEQGKQKYKMNFKGKFRPQNTPDVTASKRTEESVKAQNAAGQTWRSSDRYWKGYETVERMNILYDNIGHGSQYWDRIVNENQNKKGWRDREVQEQLNMIAHEKAMIRENPLYESPFQKQLEEQETMRYDNDPLFKRVSKKLKKEIDYNKKPSKMGYPDNPPPMQKGGWHPEYGNRDAYYNKLDPHSAEAMPSTGNEKIDAAVEKAKKQPKKGAPAKANPPKGS